MEHVCGRCASVCAPFVGGGCGCLQQPGGDKALRVGDGFSAFAARRPVCCCSMCSCASSTLARTRAGACGMLCGTPRMCCPARPSAVHAHACWAYARQMLSSAAVVASPQARPSHGVHADRTQCCARVAGRWYGCFRMAASGRRDTVGTGRLLVLLASCSSSCVLRRSVMQGLRYSSTCGRGTARAGALVQCCVAAGMGRNSSQWLAELCGQRRQALHLQLDSAPVQAACGCVAVSQFFYYLFGLAPCTQQQALVIVGRTDAVHARPVPCVLLASRGCKLGHTALLNMLISIAKAVGCGCFPWVLLRVTACANAVFRPVLDTHTHTRMWRGEGSTADSCPCVDTSMKVCCSFQQQPLEWQCTAHGRQACHCCWRPTLWVTLCLSSVLSWCICAACVTSSHTKLPHPPP